MATVKKGKAGKTENKTEKKKQSKKQKARQEKEKNYQNLRDSSFEDVLAAVRNQFGEESVRYLSESPNCSVETISTGSFAVNNQLGIGGLPRGRIIEIFGPEAGGKTTFGLSVMAVAQAISRKLKDGKKAAVVDAECALNISLATKVGVDTDDLLVAQPDYGEQALEITQMLVESARFSVVMVDSVAALVPKKELYGEMEDEEPGLQARMMGRALRRLTGAVKRSNTMLIFINQLRDKIGVMFGNPETTGGGKGLRFFSSVRLDIRKTGDVKVDGELIGNRVRVKVVKNKLSPLRPNVVTELLFGKGFNLEGELIDFAVEEGILEKNGNWISFGEQKLGNGRLATCKFLEQNPEIYADIMKQVDQDALSANNICEDNDE